MTLDNHPRNHLTAHSKTETILGASLPITLQAISTSCQASPQNTVTSLHIQGHQPEVNHLISGLDNGNNLLRVLESSSGFPQRSDQLLPWVCEACVMPWPLPALSL